MSDLRLSDYIDAEGERITATLFEYLRIPSISAQPDHAGDVEASAQLTARLLGDAGLEHVTVLSTPGGPSVYADWLHAGADAPTVVVYGHHDVQPVDPLDEWTSPPFEPVIVDGECRARGAIDDKGQVLYEIEAARGLLAKEGRLPVNVKFLIEGEEEVGSPHFEALLQAEAERLRCDAVVVSDTGMWSAEVPSICMGMRGLVGFDVRVRTGSIDLHSGTYGGAVANPSHLIARIVAALHDADRKVTIPGFYDDVRPLTADEEHSLTSLPFDEAEWQRVAGAKRLEGESGRSTLERTWTRPTCDVVGITVGYGGDGIKTIVPAQGDFKVTFRLVADQHPDKIAAAFEVWLADQIPEGVEVTVTAEGGVAPALTPAGHPAVAALAAAIERLRKKWS
ncbi:MAG: hypothetical protein QOG03_2027, partial [Actinomycetota bacterium]|nr:hypothetical protein [Actinomycetota bacterium]